MGLLTILKKMKQKERELRLLMLGLDNAGKTTILKKFNGEDIDTISPTLGFNIKTLEHRGFKLNIWDVGGQKSLRSYWRNYFESTDGLIWVVDSADRQRMQDCQRELQNLAWPERPSSSLPTSKTCPEHCPLTPSARPWSWTLSEATTGASRAAAPSPGRTCCLASTGSWMTSPAASSWPTEPLLMPPHSAHSLGTPHPPTKHHPWKGGSPPAQLTAPAPVHILLLLLLPTAALWPAGSRGGKPVTLAVPLAPDPARLQLRDQEERAVAGRGLPLLLSRLWASPFAQL